jgi:hypothetical protein
LEINAIDVTGHTENMNVDIPLEPPNNDITIIGPDYVNVRVELHTAMETKTFTGVQINIRGALNAKGWNVSPQTANVTVERSMLASSQFDVSKPPLELYVDVTNVVAPRLVLPILTDNVAAGMNVIRIEPQQVSVSAVIP